MNCKRKLYLMLLFAFVFGLFSMNSEAFAQEMNSTAKTAIEAGEIKADAEANAAVDRESPAISEGELSDEDQSISSGGDTEAKSGSVLSEQPADERKSGVNSLNEEKANPDDVKASAVNDENAKSEEPLQDGKNLAEEGKDLESSEESNALDKKEATLEVAEEKNLEQVAEDGAQSDALYLNGQSGDDNNDGLSPEKALKTFGKARDIAKSVKETIENIFITGTVSVEGEISLEGTKAKLVRHKDFNDYLLKVDGEATLKNITIDGNSKNNKKIEKSLVYVDGGTLNIEEGAVLRNNKIKPDEGLNPTHGGAINARNHATVNMSGGSVEDNQATYGGGIQLYESTMNFTGGAVQNNRSEQVFDKPYKQYYSAGGGIIVREESVLNMSGDAKVLNNFAAEIGGGISVGSNNPEKGSVLNMDGGIVDGNTAGAAGGGIFIQAKYLSGSQGKAYINAGKITNNHMDGSGKTNKAFGGGGIYVNGVTEEYGQNGELHLENVLITENTSEWEGAGMANCPISKTTIHVNNGVAFGNNKGGNSVNDLFIYSNENYGPHSGNAKYKLSKRMLGGGLFNWTKPDGTALPDAEHEGTLVIPEGEKDAKFAANSNPEDIKLAKALAKVIISGNTSTTRGGGIGSNGSVTIGTSDGTTEIKVEKEWEDNDNANNKRPNTIKVQLYATVDGKEYLVETKEVKAQESWKAEFKDLPTLFEGAKVTYTIKEVAIDGYESKVVGNQKDGFTVTNKEKPERPPEEPPTPPTRDIHIVKKWDLVGNDKPVARIEIELYRDGKATGKVLELNESNNWSGSFTGLDVRDGSDPSRDYVYTVKEWGENGGFLRLGDRDFDVSYEGSMESGFVITNKEKPETPPETPPEEPGKPEEPETPETPDVPDKPEKPNKPGKPGAPQTGVGSDMGLWAGLASMSAAALGFIGTKKRRDEE